MTAIYRRVWSLAEIVRRFKVDFIVNLAAEVERIIATGGSDDLLIQRTAASFDEEYRSSATSTADEFRELGLPGAGASMDRILEFASSTTATNGDIRRELRYLQQAMLDGLAGGAYFAVAPGDERYLQGQPLFGDEVFVAFPSAADDIEEAGKCLAFARGTAAVFHLMRVMEHGLRAVGVSLNDPTIDPVLNPTWDRLLRRFDDELKKSVANRSPEWRSKGEFFAGVAANLHAVKNAWRNPTMHIRSKYTEEQARDIWNHVGAFMRNLATEISEAP